MLRYRRKEQDVEIHLQSLDFVNVKFGANFVPYQFALPTFPANKRESVLRQNLIVKFNKLFRKSQ